MFDFYDDSVNDIEDVTDDFAPLSTDDASDVNGKSTDIINSQNEDTDIVGDNMISENHDDRESSSNSNEGDDATDDNPDEPGRLSFTGGGFDCTCTGGCLCKHYMPKGTYDDCCFYCGHKKSDHPPR